MQTNLDKAGSLRQALETYLEPHELVGFNRWCMQEATPTIPNWVKIGQWFKDITDNTYNRIAVIKTRVVESSNSDIFLLEDFCTPTTDYEPMQIRPWTLAQVEKVMNSHQLLLLHGQTVQITQILRNLDSDTITVLTDGGNVCSTAHLAENGETDDNQPCGTPVPT